MAGEGAAKRRMGAKDVTLAQFWTGHSAAPTQTLVCCKWDVQQAATTRQLNPWGSKTAAHRSKVYQSGQLQVAAQTQARMHKEGTSIHVHTG
jgi:hypothetical protein